ncbi:MAG: sigma-54 dependent transcriptional regulator, partial [Polyangiaceae bacterium]
MRSTNQPASKPRSRVLVVDDQLSMAEMLADGLAERGYDAVACGSSRAATKLLEDEHFDALVTDLRMPQLDGFEMLAVSRRLDAERPVIVMTAYSAVESAVESIRQGAYHYLTKPFKVDEVALFLERALDEVRLRRETVSLRRTLRDRFSLANLVGKSAAMLEVTELIERVADASVPVLVVGETGTGKGVVARALHTHGNRASNVLVTVNCAALPENLLESELFGHAKGAFTGATTASSGLFAEANGGTLFLDEIGEMSPPMQAKLLNVIESGKVRAVGATKERDVDVRIIAATHRDLRELVKIGKFREDLLYRLEVVSIELPPLRYRRDDLPMLIDHFLAHAKAKHPQSPVERVGRDALEVMLEYSWPGNVRELEHTIERMTLLGRDLEATPADLPKVLSARAPAEMVFAGPILPMRDVQKRYAAWVCEQLGGRKMMTAERLGIDDKTLARLLSPA